MAGKKWLKLVRSLHQKKYRNQHGLFFVEGKKLVGELVHANISVLKILLYPEFEGDFSDSPFDITNPTELKSISALKNPNGVLGIFRIPESKQISFNNWIVALDDVRDPGNLGTIIRLCDWFGIEHLVCSESTVDLYNPKVLQATMGSLSRVNVTYTSLTEFLENADLPIYGAYMRGESVNNQVLPDAGILVMGNEANGISPRLAELTGNRLTIPQYGGTTTESLNVAMATGILLNEIRRG